MFFLIRPNPFSLFLFSVGFAQQIFDVPRSGGQSYGIIRAVFHFGATENHSTNE